MSDLELLFDEAVVSPSWSEFGLETYVSSGPTVLHYFSLENKRYRASAEQGALAVYSDP